MSSTLTSADELASGFAQLGLPGPLVDVLLCGGITQPLPIQALAIADVLAGRDVSGKAPTGSGKTLAFALPIAAMVGRGRPRRPRCLVLVPTRELASQIAAEMAPLLATALKVQTFYGGVGIAGQRKALQRGVDVAVACPGRLEDLMRGSDINLSEVDVVVIDEADRMADMGFLPAVRRILDAMPNGRQTLLFSATLDGDVNVLVRRYQRQPVRHEVTEAEQESRAHHQFRTVAKDDRTTVCAQLVSDAGSSVVFVRTKHGADRLARRLREAGTATAAIHGDRSQAQRDGALEAFRSGRVKALVATDVAARGIHVDDVARVIHFDLPADVKGYVHRSGRTARAGSEGSVIALVTPEQKALAATLKSGLDIVEEVGGARSRPGPAALPRPGTGAGGARKRSGRRWDQGLAQGPGARSYAQDNRSGPRARGSGHHLRPVREA